MKDRADIINSFQEMHNIDYLRNRAEEATERQFTDKRKNPEKTTNAVFLSICDRVGRELFSGLDISNDALLLCLMVKIYGNLCNTYDKTPSLEGYANICGLSLDAVRSWSQDAKALTPKMPTIDQIIEAISAGCDKVSLLEDDYIYNSSHLGSEYNSSKSNLMSLGEADVLTIAYGRIFERLQYIREESIKNRFLSSGQQLGALALVNQEFRWDADKIKREESARALTLADLPKITDYVNKPKAIE